MLILSKIKSQGFFQKGSTYYEESNVTPMKLGNAL